MNRTTITAWALFGAVIAGITIFVLTRQPPGPIPAPLQPAPAVAEPAKPVAEEPAKPVAEEPAKPVAEEPATAEPTVAVAPESSAPLPPPQLFNHADGQPAYELQVRRGQADQLTIWRPDGSPAVVADAVAGKRDGKVTTYHTNGEVAETATYRDGLRHGLSLIRDSKGRPVIEAQYVNGVRQGRALLWTSRQTITEVVFDAGRLAAVAPPAAAAEVTRLTAQDAAATAALSAAAEPAAADAEPAATTVRPVVAMNWRELQATPAAALALMEPTVTVLADGNGGAELSSEPDAGRAFENSTQIGVDAQVQVIFARMRYNRRTDSLVMSVVVVNVGGQTIGAPVFLRLRNISLPEIAVANQAGTIDGEPFFILRNSMAPGASARVDVEFVNVNRRRFDADTSSFQVNVFVEIDTPEHMLLTNGDFIDVTGTLEPSIQSVVVNGVPAVIDGETFSVTGIPLVEGRNVISAVGLGIAGEAAANHVAVYRDTTSPHIAIETPSDGALLSSTEVDVAGLVNDLVTGTTINQDDCTILVNGVEAMVAHRAFVVPGLLLQEGANTIEAMVTDRAGNSRSVSIDVTVDPQAGQRLSAVSGNAQAGVAGTQLTNPLVVSAVDANGAPVVGIPVTFTVTRGEGQVASYPDTGSALTVLSDDNGLASILFILGDRAGGGNNRVRATAPGFVGEPEFCALALSSLPVRITTINMGADQVGVAGEALPEALMVQVTDDGGNPVGNVDVTFEVTAGGGGFYVDDALSPILVVPTDFDGRAQATLILGDQEGINNNAVSAVFDGAEAAATFVASSRVAGLAVDTTVSGLILDMQDVPIEGVTCHIEVTGVALDPVPSAVTDANGRFTISGAPVGAQHLIADGRTSNRPGRWPLMMYELTTVAGQDNNVGMPMYFVEVDTAQEVEIQHGGPDEDIHLTIDGVEGTQLTIYANSVSCPDGRDSCVATWTLVNNDRVPMPAPNGSTFTLAWTLQEPGMHFEPPARACIPNQGGIPGEQFEMYSFDHDLGEFLAIGTGTVSEDGSQLCSDPGFGIEKSGWGGGAPPPPPCSAVCSACPTPTNTCKSTRRVGRTPCDCGRCVTEDKPDGTGCDDRNPCTINDRCQGGSCSGEPVTLAGVTAMIASPPPPVEICAGSSVSFSATPGQNNCPSIRYDWTFGDGQTGSGQSTSHTYNTGGQFNVSVTANCIGTDGSTVCSGRGASAGSVTIVKINRITFPPDNKVAPNGTITAMAEVVPTGHELMWDIVGPALGCTIDPATGVVRAGSESGQIKVRATVKDLNCSKEGTLCIGGDDVHCCEDLDGTRRFGPLTVTIPGVINPGDPVDGYCPYTIDAAVSFEIQGVFSKSAALDGVTVSWKEKFGNPSDFKDVTVTWTGTKNIGKFGVIDANLTSVSVTVQPSGAIGGSLTFQIAQNADVNIGGIAVLKQGLNGSFTYTYNSGNSFAGTYDFSGIQGFEVHLKKGGSVIGKITAQNIDANGNVTNARFTAQTPGTYQTNLFTATLEQLDLGMNFSIANTTIELLDGTGRVKLTNIQNVEGNIILQLTFSAGRGSVQASVTLENVKAFNSTISGTLTADFNTSFDLQEISGNDISCMHNDFDQAITGVNFQIKNGDLERFSVGQISLKYKNAITFEMANASYSKATKKLGFDASVMLPTLSMSVEKFEVQVNTGSVSVGKVTATVNRSPVNVTVTATFGETSFTGTINGTFAGGVALKGEVTVGAEPTFNYLHVAMQVTVPGIPLGSSGLKVKSLRGEFGYNWNAKASDTATGGPQEGAIVIGFGLGISDVGNLVLVEGFVRVNLGSANSIDLEGAVKVTANAPHYLTGTMTISYTLGSESVSGSLSSTIKFPPSTGNMVRLNTGTVTFGIDRNRWSVNGSGFSGTIFDVVTVTAGINVGGPLSNLRSISGSLSGSISYQDTLTYAYPSGFDGRTCATADATDSFFGFGIDGQLDIMLSGSMNVNLNADGITGSVSVSASGSSTMRVKWPCIFCGDDCVDIYSVSASGTLTLSRTSSSTRIQGEVTFTSGGESETGQLDLTL